MEKSVQYAKPDVQCKQRDGNAKKKSKANAKKIKST